MDDLLKEAALESFLFHSEDKPLPSCETSSEADPTEIIEEKDPQELQYFEDVGSPSNDKPVDTTEEMLPVWQDASDDTMDLKSQYGKHVKRVMSKAFTRESMKISEYEAELRRMHQEMHSSTDWATIRPKKRKAGQTDAEEYDTPDNLLSNAQSLLAQPKALPKGRIEVSAVSDANQNDPLPSRLASMEYSPDGSLFVTATKTGRISLFHIDGVDNPFIDAVSIKGFKTIQAGFLPNKEQILAIGSPQFQSIHVLDLESQSTERLHSQDTTELFHSYATASLEERGSVDLVAFVSNKGTVPIYSLKSQQWISRIQSNRAIEAAVFVGNNLYTSSAGGRVHVWDMRSFRCLTEFIDQGTLHCTSLKVCPKQQYLATGSDAGVVNIYKAGDCMLPSVSSSTPSPVKTIFNLRTEIDTIEFHPASQMVAIGSMHMTSAIRLVHLPSCTIFANWPNQRLSKTRVKCVSFSPGGDLMHVGSLSGRISSYRLMHYFK